MSATVDPDEIDQELLDELRAQGGDINNAIEIHVRMLNPEEFLSEMRAEDQE